MTSILITNIKGGVAKSSTAVALATGLKLENPDAKVLLIDGDPQGSIKTYFGLKLPDMERDFSAFLIDGIRFEDSIQPIPVGDGALDVMVSGRKLSEADIRMASLPRREETLKTRFKKQNIEYDYVVIDSSPAMNLVLLNFMTFADHWLIPATMDAFAISNINYLFEQKTMIEEFYDMSPNIMGILPTMFDKRTVVSQQALEAVKMKFSDRCTIFEPIAVDSGVKKAQIKRQLIYDVSGSRAAESYRQLTQNVMEMI